MNLVDAHCHLHEDAAIGHGRNADHGTRPLTCVINGTSPRDWGKLAEYCSSITEVKPAYGVHPWHVEHLPEGWINELRQRLSDPRATVGEIGLDFSPEKPDRALQESVFTAQVKLANELNRPISIHGVKAWDRILQLLNLHGAPNRGFLLHAYSGSEKAAASFVALGAYFGVSMRTVNRTSINGFLGHPLPPLDRILPESDARIGGPLSDSSPSSHTTPPETLEAVHKALSLLYGIPKLQLTERLARNFYALFGS